MEAQKSQNLESSGFADRLNGGAGGLKTKHSMTSTIQTCTNTPDFYASWFYAFSYEVAILTLGLIT